MSIEAQIEELRAELNACTRKAERRRIARELDALAERYTAWKRAND
ncbi:hypothetical protein SAMN05428974_0512 [Sphingopyxis sp. YR583]|nr:hypothetical protein [Sphingopyxis sp. YR583]SEH12589.1 hypothetical protein SAMN05428974_0512 [Sphingopyxis sp. YR583]